MLTRAGYDVYRDELNTPAFMAILPAIRGLSGIDIGCGEGYNTRKLAHAGARIVGIDIAESFICHAKALERNNPLGIEYKNASALDLPFPDERFDFATAIMSLMDVPDPEKALSEAYRVVKTSGFIQFSILHPCFDTPFVYIGDVARANLMAMEAEANGAYNIVSGVDTSFNELIGAFLKACGSDLQPEYKADDAKVANPVVKKLGVSVDKAKQELGWEPKVDIEEGMRRLVVWLDEERSKGRI